MKVGILTAPVEGETYWRNVNHLIHGKGNIYVHIVFTFWDTLKMTPHHGPGMPFLALLECDF